MIQIYKIARLILLGIVLLTTVILLLSESAEGKGKKNFEWALQAISYDPYDYETLSRIEHLKTDISNTLLLLRSTLTGFVSNKMFMEEIFSFFISKQMNNMPNHIRYIFTNNPYFQDFTIISDSDEIIYKYGSASITKDITTNLPLKIHQNYLTIIESYTEDSFDLKVWVLSLYNLDILQTRLNSIEYSAFLWLDKTHMKNVGELPNSVKYGLETISNENKNIYDYKILEFFPIYEGNRLLANLAIIYPSRSIWSILFTIIKIIIPIVGLILLFILNRILENLFKKTYKKIAKKSPRSAEDSDGLSQKNLDWIENYIHKTEEKK